MLPVELSCALTISISKPSLNSAGLLPVKLQIFPQISFKGFFSSGKQKLDFLSTQLHFNFSFCNCMLCTSPSHSKMALCCKTAPLPPVQHSPSPPAPGISPQKRYTTKSHRLYLHYVCNTSSSWHKQMPHFPSHTGGIAVFNHNIICKYIILFFFPITL